MASSRLCDVCNGITLVKLTSETGYQHAGSPDILQQSGETCLLCHALYRICRYDLTGSLSLRLVLDSNCLYKRVKPTSSDENDYLPDVFEELQIVAAEESVAEAYGIPWKRNISETSSAYSYEFIRKCLRHCAAHHKCMSEPAFPHESKDPSDRHHPESDAKSSPSRLIDVFPFNTETECHRNDVRLVDVVDECHYITLSHCWGGTLGPTKSTTMENLAARKLHIKFETLPRSFQDAISITRELGVRYLWIDALCIIQNSGPDWTAESIKMGAIYGNSYLTIAASDSRDSSGGCFRDNIKGIQSMTRVRALTGSTQLKIELYDLGGASRPSSTPLIFAHVIDNYSSWTFQATVNGCPLSERGWVCQERILSPRTIHYTAEKVVWECREMYAPEDYLSPRLTMTESRIPFEMCSMETMSVLHTWQAMIRLSYSLRQFKYPEDRLIAISGLAALFQKHLKTDYLAGLWLSFLPHDLCWAIRSDSQYAKYRPRRPSWTWASHDAPIQWLTVIPHLLVVDFSIQILELALFHAGGPAQTFGLVDEGYMVLSGLFNDLIVVTPPVPVGFDGNSFRTPGLQIGNAESLSTSALLTFLDHELEDKIVKCLLLGHDSNESYMLLLQPDPQHGSENGWRRVGAARMRTEQDVYVSWQKGASKEIIKVF